MCIVILKNKTNYNKKLILYAKYNLYIVNIFVINIDKDIANNNYNICKYWIFCICIL